MCRGSPKGLSHASHSNGINDQYTGPGGQMAQLKAWGGCSGKEYGITDYQITGLAPLLTVLVMTLQLIGNMQKAGVF